MKPSRKSQVELNNLTNEITILVEKELKRANPELDINEVENDVRNMLRRHAGLVSRKEEASVGLAAFSNSGELLSKAFNLYKKNKVEASLLAVAKAFSHTDAKSLIKTIEIANEDAINDEIEHMHVDKEYTKGGKHHKVSEDTDLDEESEEDDFDMEDMDLGEPDEDEEDIELDEESEEDEDYEDMLDDDLSTTHATGTISKKAMASLNRATVRGDKKSHKSVKSIIASVSKKLR